MPKETSTTARYRDLIATLSVEVLTAEGALDYDHRPTEAEAFADDVSSLFASAMSALRAALVERHPDLGFVLVVEGVEVR